MGTPQETRAATFRNWQHRFPGTTPIAEAEPRSKTCVVGTVTRIRLVPGERVDVTIDDGSGEMDATWTSFDVLESVELGRALRLTGTVCAPSDGCLMRNPQWRLISDPYTCLADPEPSSG